MLRIEKARFVNGRRVFSTSINHAAADRTWQSTAPGEADAKNRASRRQGGKVDIEPTVTVAEVISEKAAFRLATCVAHLGMYVR